MDGVLRGPEALERRWRGAIHDGRGEAGTERILGDGRERLDWQGARLRGAAEPEDREPAVARDEADGEHAAR